MHLCTKFEVCSCICSTDMKPVRNNNSVPLTLILLNPKSIGLDSVQNYYYCVKKRTRKLGSAGTPSRWGAGVADPLNTSPLPICVTTTNLVVLRQTVYAYIVRNPQNWGALGPRPSGMGTLFTPWKQGPPYMCYNVKFGTHLWCRSIVLRQRCVHK